MITYDLLVTHQWNFEYKTDHSFLDHTKEREQSKKQNIPTKQDKYNPHKPRGQNSKQRTEHLYPNDFCLRNKSLLCKGKHRKEPCVC